MQVTTPSYESFFSPNHPSCNGPSILPVVSVREDSKQRSELTGIFVYANAGEQTSAMVGGKACSRHVPLLEDEIGRLSC